MFTGGNSQASVFCFGNYAYISASIVVQLMGSYSLFAKNKVMVKAVEKKD
jgi:preprotein translocase subunit SecY